MILLASISTQYNVVGLLEIHRSPYIYDDTGLYFAASQ